MRFSSDWFYGGMVEPAPEVKHRGILDYDEPMAWIDTSGTEAYEQFVGESFGRINKREARLTLDTLQTYFEKSARSASSKRVSTWASSRHTGHRCSISDS